MLWRDEKSIDHAEPTKVERLKELITVNHVKKATLNTVQKH